MAYKVAYQKSSSADGFTGALQIPKGVLLQRPSDVSWTSYIMQHVSDIKLVDSPVLEERFRLAAAKADRSRKYTYKNKRSSVRKAFLEKTLEFNLREFNLSSIHYEMM